VVLVVILALAEGLGFPAQQDRVIGFFDEQDAGEQHACPDKEKVEVPAPKTSYQMQSGALRARSRGSRVFKSLTK
jgi:hypothetical protein